MKNEEENYVNITLEEAKKFMLEILKEVDRVCRENSINYWLQSGTLLGAVRHKGFIPWDDDIDIGMLREDFNKFKEIAKYKLKEKFYLEIHELDEMFEGMPLKVRHKNTIYIEKWDKINEPRKGIYIDVFPFDRFSVENKELRKELFPKYLYQLKVMRFWVKKITLKNILKFFVMIILKFLPNRYILYLNKKYYLKSLLKNKNDKFLLGYGYGLSWRTTFEYKEIFPLAEIEFEKHSFFCPNNTDSVLKKIYGNTYMELPPEKDRLSHSACIMIKKGECEGNRHE